MYQLNYYSSSSIYVTVHSYFKNVSQPTGSYKYIFGNANYLHVLHVNTKENILWWQKLVIPYTCIDSDMQGST